MRAHIATGFFMNDLIRVDSDTHLAFPNSTITKAIPTTTSLVLFQTLRSLQVLTAFCFLNNVIYLFKKSFKDMFLLFFFSL